LELIEAAVREGSETRFRHWRARDAGNEDSPDEFVLMCGIVGLGRELAETFDRRRHAPAGLVRDLRTYANDRRWRVREAVVLALQRLGDVHIRPLLDIAESWNDGNAYEQRAAVAALCEPRFVVDTANAERRILDLLDAATSAYKAADNQRDAPMEALRKTLSYGWSVAVAEAPSEGVSRFDRWVSVDDPGIRRIVRENLAKARLTRVVPSDVERWRRRIGE
jgi:hypothetical protein